MIYLVSAFEESYARREMQYTKTFLNNKAGRQIFETIERPMDMPKKFFDWDWFVIADVKIHPLWWKQEFEMCDYISKWEKAIKPIPVGQIIAWAGDIRFNYQLLCRGMICNNRQMFRRLTEPERGDVSAIFWNGNRGKEIVTWKDLCPDLPQHYTLAETCVDWTSPYIRHDKTADIVYIINGAMKYKKDLLNILDNTSCSLILGDWKNSKHQFLREFADKHPEHQYMSKKAWGPDWLELMTLGSYTIVAGDDQASVPGLLVTRFWEAIRTSVIPLIRLADDPDKIIYADYPYCREYCYFETAEDIDKVVKQNRYFTRMLDETFQLKQRYIW